MTTQLATIDSAALSFISGGQAAAPAEPPPKGVLNTIGYVARNLDYGAVGRAASASAFNGAVAGGVGGALWGAFGVGAGAVPMGVIGAVGGAVTGAIGGAVGSVQQQIGWY